MADEGRELVLRLHREAWERLRDEPPPHRPPQPPRELHYTQLKEDPERPATDGWNTYVREVARLIDEGHENRWVLITQGRIVGVFDSQGEAYCAVGTAGWDNARSYLIKQIRIHEPVIRLPFWYCKCHR